MLRLFHDRPRRAAQEGHAGGIVPGPDHLAQGAGRIVETEEANPTGVDQVDDRDLAGRIDRDLLRSSTDGELGQNPAARDVDDRDRVARGSAPAVVGRVGTASVGGDGDAHRGMAGPQVGDDAVRREIDDEDRAAARYVRRADEQVGAAALVEAGADGDDRRPSVGGELDLERAGRPGGQVDAREDRIGDGAVGGEPLLREDGQRAIQPVRGHHDRLPRADRSIRTGGEQRQGDGGQDGAAHVERA